MILEFSHQTYNPGEVRLAETNLATKLKFQKCRQIQKSRHEHVTTWWLIYFNLIVTLQQKNLGLLQPMQ